MNTKAYHYEGLYFNKEDFLPPPKNKIWQFICDVTERLGERYVQAERARRERTQPSQIPGRRIDWG
jgi:hypothetical protein